jgi:hypothetical protein
MGFYSHYADASKPPVRIPIERETGKWKYQVIWALVERKKGEHDKLPNTEHSSRGSK